MATAVPANRESPKGHRWQFSLRQMFVAITGVAILLGWASWGGWVKSDAVVYLAIAVLAGVLSRAARRCLLGACTILGTCVLVGFMSEYVFGPTGDRVGVDLRAVWIFALVSLYFAALLRVFTRATAWSLMGSLLLIELFIVAIIIYTYGCPTLHCALVAKYREGVFDHFLTWFPEQRWYIAAPWLLGIVVGEIIVRRRKTSGGQRQAV
jgi:hypothetical protein